MVGGLLPLVRFMHERHAVEQTWSVEVTWLRALFRFSVTR
jgi:hypothetical protein